MQYTDIDNNKTPWPAQHRSLWKRLIRKLYVQHVSDPYIPEGTKVEFVKENQKGAKFYGEIKAIKLIKNNDTANEVYIHRQMFPGKEEWTV